MLSTLESVSSLLKDLDARAQHTNERMIAWSATSNSLPPLASAALHEWFAAPSHTSDAPDTPGHTHPARADDLTLPPLSVLISIARLARTPERTRIVWIGRACWPYPPAIADLLADSLFVDPPTDAERLWTIDLALRCRAVAAVIADGRRLPMPATRRLQLAAAAGDTPGLLVRPPGELRELSAARTRWRISPDPQHPQHPPDPNTPAAPSWTIHLLRCKGLRPNPGAARAWRARIDHEKGALHLVPLAGF